MRSRDQPQGTPGYDALFREDAVPPGSGGTSSATGQDSDVHSVEFPDSQGDPFGDDVNSLPGYNHVNSSVSERPRRSRLGKAAALVALVGALGGGVIAVQRHTSGEDAGGGVYASSTVKSPTEARPPIRGELPPGVMADLEAALTHETCITRTTPAEVAEVYRDLFATEEAATTDPDELALRGKQLIAEFKHAKENLTFGTLPSNIEQLIEDADTGKRTMAEYEAAAELVFASYGIKKVYFNTPADAINPDVRGLITEKLKPLKPEDYQNKAQSKIVGIIMGMSQIPKEIINKHPLSAVAFGGYNDASKDRRNFAAAIVNEALFATAQLSKSVLVVNIADGPFTAGESPKPLQGEFAGVLRHEVWHLVEVTQCGVAYSNDAAFDLLGNRRGFAYVGENYRDGVLGQPYTVLDSTQPGLVVTATSYGEFNSREDSAEIFKAVSAPFKGYDGATNGNILQPAKGQDMTLIWEKAALSMARLKKEAPDVYTYYKANLAQRRLAVHIQKDAEVLGSAVEKYDASHPGDDPHNPAKEKSELTNRLRELLTVYQDYTGQPLLMRGQGT